MNFSFLKAKEGKSETEGTMMRIIYKTYSMEYEWLHTFTPTTGWKVKASLLTFVQEERMKSRTTEGLLLISNTNAHSSAAIHSNIILCRSLLFQNNTLKGSGLLDYMMQGMSTTCGQQWSTIMMSLLEHNETWKWMLDPRITHFHLYIFPWLFQHYA